MEHVELMYLSIEEDGRISLWDEHHPELNTRSVKVFRLEDGDIALVPPILSHGALDVIACGTLEP